LAGDFNTSSNYVASGLPKFRSLDEAHFVIHTERAILVTQLPDLSSDNLRIEVENCISALSRKDMEVIAVDVTHPRLQVPAFYTIIPGAHFRERAAATSVGMFSAKLLAQSEDPGWALARLGEMDRLMQGKYYVKFYMGNCALSLHDPERALQYLRQAMELDPREEDIPSICVYMGICLKELERYKEALAVLESAKDHDPERTDVYNLMGFCHFKLKEYEKAIKDFREVLRLNPVSAIDYANIASNYRDLGEYGKAVTYYQLALELDPSIDFARENLNRLLLPLGEQFKDG
jgi:ribosomal protein S12 methylthiotransferase accessory factor